MNDVWHGKRRGRAVAEAVWLACWAIVGAIVAIAAMCCGCDGWSAGTPVWIATIVCVMAAWATALFTFIIGAMLLTLFELAAPLNRKDNRKKIAEVAPKIEREYGISLDRKAKESIRSALDEDYKPFSVPETLGRAWVTMENGSLCALDLAWTVTGKIRLNEKSRLHIELYVEKESACGSEYAIMNPRPVAVACPDAIDAPWASPARKHDGCACKDPVGAAGALEPDDALVV